jgi:Uma2 family endonuclease
MGSAQDGLSIGVEEDHRMATIVEPRSRTQAGAQRFVLYGVGWDGYETMLELVGNRPIRLTYDRGNLELMSPSHEHERFNCLSRRLIETLTEKLGIPIRSCGSTTFRRRDLDRGLEPDACYYLAHLAEVRGKKHLDLTVDPPPDLAIEIDITSSPLDRQGIYAALGVPEIWRFDGTTLRIIRRQADGSYAPCAHSPSFPFLPPEDFVRRLLQGEEADDDTDWGRSVREWVRDELAPRLRQDGEAG